MRSLMIISALALLATGPVSVAHAQKIDKNGRCHDAAGKFAKAAVCGGAASMKSSANMIAQAPKDPGAPYKLDAKGKCHNVKGKMAAKAKCAA